MHTEMPFKKDLTAADRLPECLLGIGGAFFFAGLIAKNELPKAVGSLPIIQLPCAFFVSVLIPFASMLALRALIAGTPRRNTMMGVHSCGMILGIVMLSFYFATFWTVNRVLDFQNDLPSILPRLAQNARSLPKEEDRIKQAQFAYRLYGVILAYQRDNLGTAFYVPSEEEKTEWHKQLLAAAQSKKILDFVRKVVNQFPYLFALYAATFLASYLAGWIWLAVKPPQAISAADT